MDTAFTQHPVRYLLWLLALLAAVLIVILVFFTDDDADSQDIPEGVVEEIETFETDPGVDCVVTLTNNESVHEGNVALVSSGGVVVVEQGVEDVANAPPAEVDIASDGTVVVEVVKVNGNITSLAAAIECEPPPTSTPTSSSTTTSTTTTSTTSTPPPITTLPPPPPPSVVQCPPGSESTCPPFTG